jgi:hypothetical protein
MPRFALAAVWLAGACEKRGPVDDPVRVPPNPTPAPVIVADADATAPTSRVLTLETATGKIELRHGKVQPSTLIRDEIEIRLTDVPGPCGDGFKPPWTALAVIRVPPGPGGRFFADGRPFGTDVSAGEVMGRGVFSGYSSSAVRVTLAPFVARAGEKLRGTLEVRDASGSFEAELCPGDYGKLAALPADAPTTPLAGTVAGRAFTAARAFVRVEEHSADYQQVQSLDVFDDPSASCATTRDRAVVSVGFGGASTEVTLLGSPQPGGFVATIDPTTRANGAAWVQLDELRLEPGGKVRGTLVAATKPGAKPVVQFGGTFVAEVCPWKRQ